MSSIFETAMAAGDNVIDRVMGDIEGFAFQPMKSLIDANPTVDADRPAIPMFSAVFDEPRKLDSERFQDRSTGDPVILAVATRFGIHRPRRGDRFTRLKSGQKYKAVDVTDADGAGLRLRIPVVEIP